MKWVVRKADNVFLRGGAISVDVSDPAVEMLVGLPDGSFPDITQERYDETSPTGRRPLTPAELAASIDAQKDAEIDNNKLTQAVARATWEQLPTATRPTLLAFFGRIKQIYKGL